MTKLYRRAIAQKPSLLMAASGLALVSFVGMSAHAQDSNSSVNSDVITVTGTRLQNLQSISAKRDAGTIMDSISQDEIGRLPDFNIADALRRTAGVSTVRDEEEGLFLSVRGLNPDFTFVTLDGGALASADFALQRRTSVEAIPSTVIRRADITKSRTAIHDANAIGGQVNFVTRSAYDSEGLFATATGSIGKFTADGYDSRDNDPSLRLDGTVSNTFGTQDQFGLVLAGSYFKRDQDEARALNFYDNGYQSPNFSIWNGIENPLKRYGGFAKFEYRPSDRLAVEFSALYFRQKETFERASLVLWGDDITVLSPTTGTVSDTGGSLENLITENGKTQTGYNFKVDYDFSEHTHAFFRASLASGKTTDGNGDRSDLTFAYRGPSGGWDYGYRYEGEGIPPQHTFFNLAEAEDLNNYQLSTIENDWRNNDGTALDVEARLSHNFVNTGFSVDLGTRMRSADRSFDQANYDYKYVGASPLRLTQFGRLSDDYVAPYAPMRSVVIDNQALLAYRDAHPGEFQDKTNPANLLKSDFKVQETIYAGYANLDYNRDRLHAHAGLRIESTDVSASSYARINGQLQPIEDSHDFTHLLPSAGLSYDLSDDLIIRLGYNRALGRANYPDLNPAQTVTESAGVTTISGGNTHLDPRIADNFDASLEYYFDGGRSMASVAVFYKSIEDEIFKLTETTNLNNAPVITTQPLNGEAAHLSGIELNLIKDRFDRLPGFLADFGVSANFTYIKADATVLASNGKSRDVDFLVEQPETLANVALFYQRGPLDARISYNYTGKFASGIHPTNPDDDAFIAAFETVDAQARWQLNDQFVVMVEGRNLTNEENVGLTGPSHSRPEDYSVFGRAYFVGLSYKY
ncbi:TonB-dependent receptor [Woodsholea maritima]|uniref:TonB-dependent receptor n=1 Tax=Woodsholea maritima TaxID=240237 RepID=UPI0003A5A090|nr:TonB-dependent receptor [Woodsholea maritima]